MNTDPRRGTEGSTRYPLRRYLAGRSEPVVRKRVRQDAHGEPASWTVPGAACRRTDGLRLSGHRGAPLSMRLIFVVTTAARTVVLSGSQGRGLLRLRTLRTRRTAVPFAHVAPPQATAGGDGGQKTGWEQMGHRQLTAVRWEDTGQPQQLDGGRQHGGGH